MNRNRIIRYRKVSLMLLTFIMAVFTLTAFFVPVTVSAKGSGDSAIERITDSGNDILLKDESSGVQALDDAKDRTNSLVKWICRWVGGLVALVSLVVALFMASSHQTEQRNTALVTCAIGIVIAFAPDVINYLLGNNSF